SQPLFVVEDRTREQRDTDGVSVWDPLVPLDRALVPDGGPPEEQRCGSYLVFRKLEQDVAAFEQREERLATGLGLEGEERERAGALLVGRFEDGTPVVLQSAEGMHHPVPNNFTYADDEAGRKCPHLAHIRRMNDRTGQGPLLARRGQTYGERSEDGPPPTGG